MAEWLPGAVQSAQEMADRRVPAGRSTLPARRRIGHDRRIAGAAQVRVPRTRSRAVRTDDGVAWMDGRGGSWRLGAALAALGALTMLVGLMLGPTPGTDAESALRRIDETRTMYVVTNAIDLVGVAVLVVGLFVIARLLAAGAGGSLTAAAGGAAVVVGTALVALVLVVQTVVDPGIAERFVAAGDADAATQLAVGRAFLDFEGGLFGIAIMVEMAGIAAIGLALAREAARGRAPHVDTRIVIAGVVIAAAAGLTGIGFFVDALGWLERLEALCSLATLVWVVLLGALLYRAARVAGSPAFDVGLRLGVGHR
jgi:hypothetical protein